MLYRYDSYCGLNCGACPILGANERNDQDWLNKRAEEWQKKPQELQCRGCKTEVTSSFCSKCHMRLCASNKKLEFCVDCIDYPCENITKFHHDQASHHSVVFTNLHFIKKNGVDSWLQAEKKRWSCPECGTRFFWYTKKCRQCNTELYNAVKQEKDLEW